MIQVSGDCKSVHSEFVVCRLFLISVFNSVKIFVGYPLCHAIRMMVLYSCSYLSVVMKHSINKEYVISQLMLCDEWLDAKCMVLLTFLLTFSGYSLSVKMTN